MKEAVGVRHAEEMIYDHNNYSCKTENLVCFIGSTHRCMLGNLVLLTGSKVRGLIDSEKETFSLKSFVQF